MQLRPLAFATFLVCRLRIGACGFSRLWQLPTILDALMSSPALSRFNCFLFVFRGLLPLVSLFFARGKFLGLLVVNRCGKCSVKRCACCDCATRRPTDLWHSKLSYYRIAILKAISPAVKLNYFLSLPSPRCVSWRYLPTYAAPSFKCGFASSNVEIERFLLLFWASLRIKSIDFVSNNLLYAYVFFYFFFCHIVFFFYYGAYFTFIRLLMKWTYFTFSLKWTYFTFSLKCSNFFEIFFTLV